MIFKNSNISTLSAITFVAALAFGASSAMAGGTHGSDNGAKTLIGEAGNVSEVTRTIEIKMYDSYFEPENIEIKEGETVRFIVKNEGEFVHEFNIGTASMHAGHQQEMMMMVEHGALEADKINHNMMKMDMGNGKIMEHNDPNSVLLEPTKSAEIIWKFSKKSKLEFACNVPGHYESGMVGNVRFNG
ncbi:MAG: cupredoxin domain-containing protein [Sneathiella sp.]|nr:cupredoxin domain-containing protein [Sneathiella sp.]